MVQSRDTCHGGTRLSLADAVLGAACNSGPAAALRFSINHLCPVSVDDHLAAEMVRRFDSGRTGVHSGWVTAREGASNSVSRRASHSLPPRK